MAQTPTAFTQSYDHLAIRLLTKCGVSKPFIPFDGSKPELPIGCLALWDTGATTSAITKELADKLGLLPFSRTKVSHAGGTSAANLYKVNIYLPNRVAFHSITVMEAVLNKCDALIGMDIISKGDFVITNRNNKTIFSFQMPSTHEYDFVKQINNSVGVKNNKRKKKKAALSAAFSVIVSIRNRISHTQQYSTKYNYCVLFQVNQIAQYRYPEKSYQD